MASTKPIRNAGLDHPKRFMKIPITPKISSIHKSIISRVASKAAKLITMIMKGASKLNLMEVNLDIGDARSKDKPAPITLAIASDQMII